MDDATADLVLALQLEDLIVLNRDVPEIFRGNIQTDAQLALNLYREELRQNASIISDHRLGERVGRADGVETRAPSPVISPTPIFDEVLARPVNNPQECVACEEAKDPEQLIVAPCGDSYCDKCVSDLFTHAMNDESMFPPRCCREPIPIALVENILNEAQISLFGKKEIEFATPDRTYCHITACGEFIPPDAMEGEKGICRECFIQTCTRCKAAAHEGDCPRDPNHALFLRTAEARGYRACYRCRRMVELTIGCNHIT